ncbi:Lysozyme inhibitor LprI N-terminal domain-containing protein [Bordetella tumbae]|uniref:lysozyme inhibitor LprI family protein n=1 Tax=Bordetella tumbae TaxID=1649139 RepID=UPI0039EE074D
MRRQLMLLAVPLMALHSIASAQSDPCADAATQADINECVGKAYKKADADLNAAYKQAATRLKGDDDQHKKLITAQREWIKFRDAECDFVTADAGGGSAYSMALSACLTTLTQDRTKQLKGYLACPEGDISCPITKP